MALRSAALWLVVALFLGATFALAWVELEPRLAADGWFDGGWPGLIDRAEDFTGIEWSPRLLVWAGVGYAVKAAGVYAAYRLFRRWRQGRQRRVAEVPTRSRD